MILILIRIDDLILNKKEKLAAESPIDRCVKKRQYSIKRKKIEENGAKLRRRREATKRLTEAIDVSGIGEESS